MQNTEQKTDQLQIRWLIRRDMPQVLRIERASFAEHAWTEDEFLACMRQRNCIGMVAERGDLIVGFFIYELYRKQLTVLSMAVDPEFKRQGFGTQMVGKLITKLTQQRRHTITTLVRETNLSAQLFFRACGFEATAILHDEYDDTDELAYEMKYTLESVRKFAPKNRISEFSVD